MSPSSSTPGGSGFLYRSFARAAAACGSALMPLVTFTLSALKSSVRMLNGGEIGGLEASPERAAWERMIGQEKAAAPVATATPRKPQFMGGPLCGLEGFALDSPSQEFYFPTSKENPGRFAYYVVHGGDWWFIGWRTKEEVMAGG